MEGIVLVIILIAGLAIGGFVGYYFRKLFAAREVNSAESKAEEMLKRAKEKQSEILLEAKDKAIKIIDESKKEAEERRAAEGCPSPQREYARAFARPEWDQDGGQGEGAPGAERFRVHDRAPFCSGDGHSEVTTRKEHARDARRVSDASYCM